MPADDSGTPIWRRLPRGAYWSVGAAVAFFGGYIANAVAADLPLDARFPVWLAGSAVIFLGLCIVALGTRSRVGGRRQDGTD